MTGGFRGRFGRGRGPIPMWVDAGAVSDHLCVVWSQIPRLKASMSASRRLFLEEPLALLPFCRTLLSPLYRTALLESDFKSKTNQIKLINCVFV
jgi:hypothetical protein